MNNFLTGIAIVLVGILAIGAYYYPSYVPQAGSSPAGSTFSTAKAAATIFVPSNGATSTSMYNSDANDRYVTGINVACTGVGNSFTAVSGAGLATLFFRAAVVANTNNAAVVPIATTTSIMQVASTTVPTSAYMQVWGAGTYMTVTSNATNTATCTVSLPYLPG